MDTRESTEERKPSAFRHPARCCKYRSFSRYSRAVKRSTRVPKRGFGCLELWPSMDYGRHISVVSPLESGWKSPSHEVGGHSVAYRWEDCGGCRTNFLSSQWLGCHAGVQSCCKNYFTTTLQPRLRPLKPKKSEKMPLPSKNANGRHLSDRISQNSIVGQSLFSF